VNPDEVVAVGAAVQAGVLSGDVKGVLLLDVTPLSLGINANGGQMSVIIPATPPFPRSGARSTPRPWTTSPAWTSKCSRASVPWSKATSCWASSTWATSRRAPRGMPQIEVVFDIDANGIVHVTAKDKGTARTPSITLTAAQASPRRRSTQGEGCRSPQGDDEERKAMLEEKNHLDQDGLSGGESS